STVFCGKIVKRYRHIGTEFSLIRINPIYLKRCLGTNYFLYANSQYIYRIVIVSNRKRETAVSAAAPLHSRTAVTAALYGAAGCLPINLCKVVCCKSIIYRTAFANAQAFTFFNLFNKVHINTFAFVVIINTPYFLIPGKYRVVCGMCLYSERQQEHQDD